jgi:AcrR family transcriptional regulator
MSRRRDAVEETRRRLVAAAFELHAEIGPSRTTIRAIAERAGVQRHTVYAHFPDLDALYQACTAHGMRETAMPEPASWVRIEDPLERLATGLAELYAWYRANERMLLNVLLDGGAEAAEAASTAPDPFSLRMVALGAALGAGLDVRDRAQGPYHRAVIAHALGFETWRSLTAAGLTDAQAIGLLVATLQGLADGALRPGA